MDAEGQRQSDFLVKHFAYYVPEVKIMALFYEEFGKYPTVKQLAMADLGAFMHDKRHPYKDTERFKLFKKYRKRYEDEDIPIRNPEYRLHKYQEILDRVWPAAMESGNFGRVTDVMQIAAKDSQGGFAPARTISIDNRSVNISGMTDDELNRRLRALRDDLKLNLPDMMLIDAPAPIIEHDAED